MQGFVRNAGFSAVVPSASSGPDRFLQGFLLTLAISSACNYFGHRLLLVQRSRSSQRRPWKSALTLSTASLQKPRETECAHCQAIAGKELSPCERNSAFSAAALGGLSESPCCHWCFALASQASPAGIREVCRRPPAKGLPLLYSVNSVASQFRPMGGTSHGHQTRNCT